MSSRWYSANRERINARRRARYKEDSGHRDTRKQSAREAMRKHRLSGMTWRKLAGRLHCKEADLSHWCSLGLFPAPAEQDGTALFTEVQVALVEAVKNAVQKFGLVSSRTETATSLAFSNWSDDDEC